MTMKQALLAGTAIAFATMLAGAPTAALAQQASAVAAPAIDADDIGGIVTSRTGPESGVWVVAETTELGTRFAKMAVTDDYGRYVIPDLPKATYRVWVRGYGLVDSPKVTTEPGRILNLTAVIAPNLAAAAQYYPAIYWASMIRVPDRSKFPGTGADGNGIPVTFKTQDLWLNTVKTNGCGNCHQIGNYATRNIPEALGHFDSSIAAWARRLQSGPAGRDMVRFMAGLMTPEGGHLAALADWTDRIKAGEIPSATPPRPVGIERNLVVTVRDWGDPKHYLHDLTLTDRRKPTVNGYGLIYGAAELSTDNLPILDPVKNTKTTMKVPVADPKYTPSSAIANPVNAPSAYFGTEQVWDTQVNAHNPMMDQDGRVYYTAQTRSPKDPPDYCKKDSPLRSAQRYALAGPQTGFVQNSRQVTVCDPQAKKFPHIDPCFGTHHLNVAEDANNTLWLSNNTQGERAVVGWINTKLYWETGDPVKSQGWTPLIVDTNGNGSGTRATTSPASRPTTARTPAFRSPCMRSPIARLTAQSGDRISPIPATSCASRQARTRPKPRWRKSIRFHCPASVFAAATSIVTAWCGCRSTPATLQALTGASARGRSTGPARSWARNVLRALRFIQSPGRASRAMRAQKRIRITPGWTSTTFSALAPTFRLRPVISPTRSMHWSTVAWSSCGCRIRWASSPRASTAASTIPMPAGRAGGCGSHRATVRQCTSKASTRRRPARPARRRRRCRARSL